MVVVHIEEAFFPQCGANGARRCDWQVLPEFPAKNDCCFEWRIVFRLKKVRVNPQASWAYKGFKGLRSNGKQQEKRLFHTLLWPNDCDFQTIFTQKGLESQRLLITENSRKELDL